MNELGRELQGYKGDLRKLGDVNILVGPKAKAKPKAQTLILYGNCLKKHADQGVFIHGCPPGLSIAGTGTLRPVLRKLAKGKK